MATKFQCELSWSASRAREFARCKRENWYARYASWGWWLEEPRGEKYEAMVHKNLTNLAAFAGDCVHRGLEHWLVTKRGGTLLTSEELFDHTVELFRAGWRESSQGGWKRRPNKTTHLEEHHYGIELEKARTDGVRDRIRACSTNFFAMPELAPVRESVPADWLAVEDLDTYQFLETKVYAVPDFALRDGERVHIYDWKTGRPNDADVFQLHTYAHYAREKWQVEPAAITLHGVYLSDGAIQSIPVELTTLEAVQDEMAESLRAMQAVHYDPDVEAPRMENWPTDGAPEGCFRCRFRGICEGAASL